MCFRLILLFLRVLIWLVPGAIAYSTTQLAADTTNYTAIFTDGYLNVTSSNPLPLTPLDFTVSFGLLKDIHPTEYIAVKLPRFTQRLTNHPNETAPNITFSGNLTISPSYNYAAEWIEGQLATDVSFIIFLLQK